MVFTDEDIKFVNEVEAILGRGHYPNGEKLSEIYKRVLAEEISQGKYPSNLSKKCGSCLKKMGGILAKTKEEWLKIKEKEDIHGNEEDKNKD